jgi:hypothetical protein|tara:strand:- start:5694 stop:5960 length:267 start_codon:yes stop_codon:yes gene_type:complete
MKDENQISGQEFVNLIMTAPIILAFVILGILIIWKTTTNPVEVAPHLDIILVAFAIFSNPVSIIIGAVAQNMLKGTEKDGKKKENKNK